MNGENPTGKFSAGYKGIEKKKGKQISLLTVQCLSMIKTQRRRKIRETAFVVGLWTF